MRCIHVMLRSQAIAVNIFISFSTLVSKNLRLGLTIKDSNIPKDLSDSRKPENLLMGLGIDTTRKFFKSNKYLDPIKENILNNFSKSTLLKKITKRVANLGLS